MPTERGAVVALSSDWFLGNFLFLEIHTGVCKAAAGPSREDRSSVDQADPIPLLLLSLAFDDLTKISFGAALAERRIN